MPNDTIVTCMHCRREVIFGLTYTIRNGNRADTFECMDLRDCDAYVNTWSIAPITYSHDIDY